MSEIPHVEHVVVGSDRVGALSLFDIADFIWRYKWMLALGMVLGLLAGVTHYLIATAPVPTKQVTFSIYPTGSPSYTRTEIADQLTTLLSSADYKVISARGDSAVVISLSTQEVPAEMFEIVKHLTNTIDNQVAESLKELNAATPRSASILYPYLRYKSFADGRANGSIQLISNTTSQFVPRDERKLLFIGWLALGIAGALVISVAQSFVRHWLKHRQQQDVGGRS